MSLLLRMGRKEKEEGKNNNNKKQKQKTGKVTTDSSSSNPFIVSVFRFALSMHGVCMMKEAPKQKTPFARIENKKDEEEKK